MDIRAAFDNGLAFTVDREVTVMTVISPELSNNANQHNPLTTPHKNTTLTRRSKDETVLTVINVYIGCDIEDKVGPIFTAIDIELLAFNRVKRFYSELGLFGFEEVVFGVEGFLFYF